MSDSTNRDLFNAAVQSAEQMANRSKHPSIAGNDYQQAFDQVVDALEREGVSAADFLPATGAGERLGFAKAGGRKGLLEAYLKLLRAKLCTPDGELQKLVNTGLQSVAAALVTLIITTLALPIVAIPLAGVLAGIMLTTGVEAFCEWSAPEPNA